MSSTLSNSGPAHVPTEDHFHSKDPHGAGFGAYLKLMPSWLMVGFALVLIAALILIGFRDSIAADANFKAMSNCDARLVEKVYGAKYAQVLGDGYHEGFGSVHIAHDRNGVANVVSICDRNPQSGLALFRRGLAEGNKSAKLVALYCAEFLAHAQVRPQTDSIKGVLEASDFSNMLKLMDPKVEPDVEIRRAAQRTVSDLVVLTNVSAKDKYEKLPPELPGEENNSADDSAAQKGVKTKEGTLDGKPVLLVRWSSLNIARAWWKENAKEGAAWDKDKQRFVIP